MATLYKAREMMNNATPTAPTMAGCSTTDTQAKEVVNTVTTPTLAVREAITKQAKQEDMKSSPTLTVCSKNIAMARSAAPAWALWSKLADKSAVPKYQ